MIDLFVVDVEYGIEWTAFEGIFATRQVLLQCISRANPALFGSIEH